MELPQAGSLVRHGRTTELAATNDTPAAASLSDTKHRLLTGKKYGGGTLLVVILSMHGIVGMRHYSMLLVISPINTTDAIAIGINNPDAVVVVVASRRICCTKIICRSCI